MDSEEKIGVTALCPMCRAETYHVGGVRMTVTSSQWNGDEPESVDQSLWQCVACGSRHLGKGAENQEVVGEFRQATPKHLSASFTLTLED
ncbi:MAG: hypothetical protein ACE5EP_02835 [Candidatus Methylomirabilales bacterium]